MEAVETVEAGAAVEAGESICKLFCCILDLATMYDLFLLCETIED